MNKVVKISALAFIMAMASGCQNITREEFDAVKNTANSALSEARAAKSAADAAASAASAAQTAADSAKAAAAAAQACCDANTARDEEMFKKKMHK